MLHFVKLIKAWAYYGFTLIPGIEVKEVPVTTLSGVVVDNRTLFGPVVKVLRDRAHMVVRVYLDKGFNKDKIYKSILKAEKRVKEANPCLDLFGCPDGWCKLDLKGELSYVDLLFMDSGTWSAAARSDAFRRMKLLFRGNKNSKHIGVYRTAVVAGGSMVDLDGQSIIRQKSMLKRDQTCHTSCLQWTGYEDATRFLKDIHNWGIIIKGMVRIVNDHEWYRTCKEYNIDPDSVDVICPEITAKFGRGPVIVDVDYTTIQVPLLKAYMTLGLQALVRLPLTPFGQKVVFYTWREILREIRAAYSDLTGKMVMALYSRLFKDEIEDETDPAKKAELVRKLEEMQSTVIKMAYLPRKAEVFINKTIPVIFEKYAKKIKLPGVTGKALADPRLQRDEIILPRKIALYHGVKLGDIVTCFRYPNTGIECFEAKVVGFTDEDCIFINARLWAERCSGDMDGDTIAVGFFNGIVDVVALENQISTKKAIEKQVKSGSAAPAAARTLADVLAQQFYIKLQAVTEADRYITNLIEYGGDVFEGREIMQLVLDSLKGNGVLPDIQAKAEINWPGIGLRSKPIYTILKGNFGDKERDVIFKYNHAVYSAKKMLSTVPFLRDLDKELFYLLAPTERIYSSSDKAMEEPYKAYGLLANAVKRPDMKQRMGYKADRYLDSKIEPIKRILQQELNVLLSDPNVASAAVKVHNAYDIFTLMLRDRDTKLAYEKLNGMCDTFRKKPEAYGKVLRAVWLCITLRHYVDGMHVTNLETRAKTRKVASGYTMFSHFPIVLGSWDLRNESKRLGGAPDLDIVVVGRQGQ